MAEHTPTPWKVGGYSSLILPVEGSGAICKFESIHGMYDNFVANAVFIVKAVNSHDALMRRVAALELIIAEEVNPFSCRDDLNRMLVEEICNRIPGDVGSPGKPL